MQLAAWDDKNGVFNYYLREQRPSETSKRQEWVWAGNSENAFTDGSRGEGPFDGHVGGSLVMKELRYELSSLILANDPKGAT